MQLDLELYRDEIEVGPGARLSFIDISPQRPAQTLVLLHGFGGNARQWQYQMEAFSDVNRVLAVDVRGHGQSSAPGPNHPAGGYDMPRLLADLDAILAARQVNQPFVLAGHSFGGAIATDYALAHPERVRRLVLIASAGEYELVRLYRALFLLPTPLLRTLQPVFRRFVRASGVALKELYWQNLNQWNGWERFPQVKTPTLVITGERDRVFSEVSFSRVGELVPDAEVVNVGASAHMVMLERHDAVNRAIERFIAADPAGGRYTSWWEDRPEPGTSRLVAERPWLVHYESGVPHTIDIPRLPLTRLFDRACQRFASREAVIFKGRALRFTHLRDQVDRLATALHQMGVAQGTRVMLLLPNVPHLIIAYYAVLRLGGIVVMSNPRLDADELAREAQVSGATVLITLASMQAVALAVRGQSEVSHIIYGWPGNYLPHKTRLAMRLRPELARPYRPALPLGPGEFRWGSLLRQHRPEPLEVLSRPEDPAVIQFTGGTTNRPKGVTLSHANLVANTMQTRAWLSNVRDGEETILCVVPFSHVYGMTAGMNLAINIGATMLLLPTFEPQEVLEHIRKYHPTLFPGVPSMYVAINNFPEVRKYDVNSIRACLCGAAPLPVEVQEQFEKLTKGRLVEGYGLSEAAPVTHANPLFGRDKVGSIGLPLPNTEARIVDLITGVPLPAGQIGELLVRGPQVMLGYWNDDEATSGVLGEDGWLHTNDIARMDDDGYFQIVSRRQDIWHTEDDASIAFPRDVEEVIYELPQVMEVVVVGIANRPVAFVKVKEDAWLPARTIIAYCERRLPPNRVPRKVIFVKEFPRSFIGKVLRRELLSQYEHRTEASAGTVGEHLLGSTDEHLLGPTDER